MKLYSPQAWVSNGTKVEVVARFLHIELSFARIPRAEWQSPEYLAKHPLGKVPTLQTAEGCIYESHAIMRYLARKAGRLYGETAFETASIDQWLEFINVQVSSFLGRILYQLLGYAPPNRATYFEARQDMLTVLKVVDAHLKDNQFLAGKALSIADISLAVQLRYVFRLLFDQKIRKTLPNFTQWFVRISETKEFIDHFGKLWLCQKQFIPFFEEKPKADKPKTDKPKAEKPKAEKPKAEKETKEEKPKKKKKEEDEEEEENPFAQKKKANPLDALPKSPFNIDDWKREFCNTPDRKGSLQKLWANFDVAGWSIWKTHYNKDESEGKVGFLTNNLKNGFLRNLDTFRKYTFAVLGVYGEEGNYCIEGAWMWRGTEIPEEWKEHQSFDFFKFDKLNPKDENDQNLVTSYWLGIEEDSIVEGKKVYEAGWFK